MVSSVTTAAAALTDAMSCLVQLAVTLSSAGVSMLRWQRALLWCLLLRPGRSWNYSTAEPMMSVRVALTRRQKQKPPCHFYLRSERDGREVGVWCGTCYQSTYTAVTYSFLDLWFMLFLKMFEDYLCSVWFMPNVMKATLALTRHFQIYWYDSSVYQPAALWLTATKWVLARLVSSHQVFGRQLKVQCIHMCIHLQISNVFSMLKICHDLLTILRCCLIIKIRVRWNHIQVSHSLLAEKNDSNFEHANTGVTAPWNNNGPAEPEAHGKLLRCDKGFSLLLLLLLLFFIAVIKWQKLQMCISQI